MKYCGKCGKQNANVNYCAYCGSKLSAAAAVPEKASKRSFRKNVISIVSVGLLVIMSVCLVACGGAASTPEIETTPTVAVVQQVSKTEAPRVTEAVTETIVEETQIHLAATEAVELENAKSVEDKRPIAVDGGHKHSVILYNDGTVKSIGDDTYAQRSTSGWRNIIQISAYGNHTVGLKADGTVVACGSNEQGQCDVKGWTDIVAVAAGMEHTVGVRADGTVVAAGANTCGQCDVDSWTNVKKVVVNNASTFALTYDGEVLVCGAYQDRNLENWQDIVDISASANHVVGLHSDGTISAVGANDQGQRDNIEKWQDIRQVAAGYGFSAGLREKGTVWVHGCDVHNEHAAMQWSDIVAIGSGTEHILGIKRDGTLIAKGTNDCGQCDVVKLNP